MKKFYHGTDGKNLKTILRRGIEPRGKRQSVWGAPSCATAVYLTRTMPEYYATAFGDHPTAAIFDIDPMYLGWFDITPDEDYIERMTRKQDGVAARPTPAEIEERLAHYRAHIQDYQKLWPECLEEYGTCAYHGVIPPEAIKRYALIERAQLPEIVRNTIADQTPDHMGLQFGGRDRARITDWLFGAPLKAEMLYVRTFTDDPQELAEELKFFQQRLDKTPKLAGYLQQLQADLDAHKGVKLVEREPAR